MTERRNPYLVLGLPFGASRDEAVRSFARRTKFLRRLGPSSRARHTDLTGALHEIETAEGPADTRMAPYRIPADPGAAALASAPSSPFGEGVFAPAPTPLDVAPDLSDLRSAAAFEFLRHLVRERGQRLGPPSP